MSPQARRRPRRSRLVNELSLTIDQEDIAWATGVLDLPPTAFTGPDGTDPRAQLLKSLVSHDIAACPGSGKTTLLVAKLAILARKWRFRTRGICALSHTNVARYEIEKRLSNTDAGRHLLSYPHYIGTIHAFVSEFLAVPWLRSRGYPVKIIDTAICEKRRWSKLSHGTKFFLERNHIEPFDLCLSSSEFAVSKKSGKSPCGENTPTYKDLVKSLKATAEEGYHCYDDLFLWANNLIETFPEIVEIIRMRFPIVFVDEAQDNSESQSAILHRLFEPSQASVIRQRFGDPNQAIFDALQLGEATTDKFPNDSLKKDIPNSHRFGQTLANFADPLGLTPYGLQGQGTLKRPLGSGELEGKHTIFIFSEPTAKLVLDAYGNLLLNTFSDDELRQGRFTAVGHIHSPSSPDPQKFPQHVGDYWEKYDPLLASRTPNPQSFLQFIRAGAREMEQEKEAYPYVNRIAEGILRLTHMLTKGRALSPLAPPHRQLLKRLEESTSGASLYTELVSSLVIKQETLTEAYWTNLSSSVRKIAEAIADDPVWDSKAHEFLDWNDEPEGDETTPRVPRDNVFRYVNGPREARISVGSIHSVKGETHTGTLVLETFWHKHGLAGLIPWLSGEKNGQTGKHQIDLRLKVHYVAMTRPTHLLCLAMHKKSLSTGDGDLSDPIIQKLKARSWNIVEL